MTRLLRMDSIMALVCSMRLRQLTWRTVSSSARRASFDRHWSTASAMSRHWWSDVRRCLVVAHATQIGTPHVSQYSSALRSTCRSQRAFFVDELTASLSEHRPASPIHSVHYSHLVCIKYHHNLFFFSFVLLILLVFNIIIIMLFILLNDNNNIMASKINTIMNK